jgi:tripartite-type tricarboxylate transporter receptor subunit TctC
VVIDNKPGAGGLIAASEAARAAPDGYTLLLGVSGNMVIAPASYSKLPYDPLKDFVPVSQVVSNDFVLLSNPSKVPARNVKAFVEWSSQQPQGIFMGTFGAGTPGHFAAYIFGDAVRLKPEVVHYKNTNDVMVGLLAGDVQGVFGSVGVAAGNVKAGKLVALGATGPKRNPALPDVPTMKEQGYGNLEITSWFGIMAPAKTPDAVVARLSADIQKVVQMPDTQASFEAAGFTATGTTREEFARILAADTATWGKAVRATGFKAD